MELNRLYYFFITAKHQHVTKASEELHIAQPALTKSIKSLEKELDLPLFYKRGRNICLTPFGEHLRDRLRNVFDILDKLPSELEEMKNGAADQVKINVLAASDTVTTAIVGYKKTNEHTVFHVIQNETESDCDISITTNTFDLSGLPPISKQNIFEEQIFLAVPKKSSLADKDSISLSEVRKRGFINLSGNRAFRNICDRLCRDAGFSPRIIFESDSPVAVKNLIATGAGIGFWPAFSWGKVSEDITLLSIDDPLCKRELIISLHDTNSLSEVAAEFYNYLTAFLGKQQRKAARKS